jgi:hypothetical protein
MNAKLKIGLLCISIISTLAACSDKNAAEKTAAEKEHFMSEKMQTINKAEQVNQLVQDAADQQRRRIDEESQ